MKTRTSFVSNSSTSSFLLAVPDYETAKSIDIISLAYAMHGEERFTQYCSRHNPDCLDLAGRITNNVDNKEELEITAREYLTDSNWFIGEEVTDIGYCVLDNYKWVSVTELIQRMLEAEELLKRVLPNATFTFGLETVDS